MLQDSSRGMKNRAFEKSLTNYSLNEKIAYYEKKDIFPHEVGVFLGYPLCDIQGFIKSQGDAYLFSGYWKIYDNLNQTLLKFADFDRAKEEAVDEWFAGKKLYEIAC